MTRIGYIGYGELGRQIASLLTASGVRHERFLFDDNRQRETVPNAFPFDQWADERFSDLQFYVCLGYKHLERKSALVSQMLAAGRDVRTFIHSTCHVHPSATVARGSVVYPMCNLDTDVAIGYGVLLNNSVVVSHNTTIGDGCYLAPGVVVSGAVTIGTNTFIGSGAVIANDVSIGEGATIGIGTVVTKDVPDGCSAIGNPMRIVNRPLRLT